MGSVAATRDGSLAPGVPAPLTAAQVADFERHGFLVIDRPVVAAEEIAWARQTIETLFEKGAGAAEGRHLDLSARAAENPNPTPQILHPWLFAPELRRLGFRDTALAIARQLLGPAAVPSGEHAILKPAQHGGITPWHQDEAFRDPRFDYSEISIWIALTDATEENGAVRYLPGSHRGPVREHRPYGGVLNASSIECVEPIDATATVLAALPAGGVAIHHRRVVHGAGPNRSGAPRLGYVLVLAAPPVPASEPRDFPWRQQYDGSRAARRRQWRRRGGVVIDQIRRIRFGPLGDRCYRWFRGVATAVQKLQRGGRDATDGRPARRRGSL